MKKLFLIGLTMSECGFANAQKVAKIENGGRLTICDVANNNYTTNCNTVEGSGVEAVSIGNSKIAIVYKTGRLTIYNLDRSNYRSNENTLESSGVSGVQMNGDQKIVITYKNNRKMACDLDRYNYRSNCQNF